MARIGHVDKNSLVHRFPAVGGGSSMHVSDVKQLIPMAFQSAIGTLLIEDNFLDKCKLWIEPNSDLVSWFGKRKKVERLLTANRIEDSGVINDGIVPENMETKERPMLLDLADLLAYSSVKALSNDIKKGRRSDRVVESIYKSMNPMVAKFRQIDPKETKDILLPSKMKKK